jgi:hypothetical protein
MTASLLASCVTSGAGHFSLARPRRYLKPRGRWCRGRLRRALPATVSGLPPMAGTAEPAPTFVPPCSGTLYHGMANILLR